MATITNRRPVMTLYSVPTDAHSHRARMVLAEKDIVVDIVDIDPDNKPEDLLAVNPYDDNPTLVDRELMLYDSRIIMEYLDERFPHPPLLPVDPVSRARCRLALYRIEHDWYSLVDQLKTGQAVNADQLRKELRESITLVAPILERTPYFLYDEFTIVDCSIAPILWRLPVLGIDLPNQAKALMKYADRIFARPCFQASLSEAERQMRR
ncbi:MAG: glutathione S-transferase N-terminal domain-containing protein [Gammaproteobacteria bacterium]|nr:glutathione S-transferase N-terminal domain-containing protein [Gammaproteobacteria bacterium]